MSVCRAWLVFGGPISVGTDEIVSDHMYAYHKELAMAQASLCIHAVSPEPSLFTHMKYGSKRRVRPKIRHPAHWMATHTRLRMGLRRTKSAINSWDDSYGFSVKQYLVQIYSWHVLSLYSVLVVHQWSPVSASETPDTVWSDWGLTRGSPPLSAESGLAGALTWLTHSTWNKSTKKLCQI